MAAQETLLQLVNVSKRFDSASGAEPLHVLRDITFTINAAESVAIVGPSGSGKTTLLNLIGTLDVSSSGRVILGGQDLSQLNEERLAVVRNRQMGFIFQFHHLLPQCTVFENVLIPLLATRDKSLMREGEARAQQLLQRVGLGERLHHRPGQLSGGERQRVAVVRALINQPKLLLADEPTGALDRASAQSLGRLLVELNQEQGVTLIVVTHALDLAHQMSRVLELKDGQLQPEAAR